MKQKEKKEKEPELLPEGNLFTVPEKSEPHEVGTPMEKKLVAPSTEATVMQETPEPTEISLTPQPPKPTQAPGGKDIMEPGESSETVGAVVSENDTVVSEHGAVVSEDDTVVSEDVTVVSERGVAITGEERYRAMDLVSGKLLHQISKAIDQLDIQVIRELRKEKELVYDHPQRTDKATMETVVERETLTTIHGPIDRNGIKLLAAALKDVKEIQMLRDPLDIREQEAKIAKLQREVQSESDSGAILVTFTPETEALSD